MANKQGWRDFAVIIGRIKGLVNDIAQMNNDIERLLKDKQDIIDDPDRKDELKTILDINPDYSINWVATRIAKLEELKSYLEDNRFLS